MTVALRQCQVADLETLRDISYRTYDQTFRHMNTTANMDSYLATAFDREHIRRELACPESTFFFLIVDGEPAGYVKVNEAGAQSDLNDPRSLELERIYVDAPFLGRGMGKVLIEKGLEVARQKGRTFVWLGVWEKNDKAIGFYARSGFTKIGTHDFIMCRDL